jgi:hypothetical protein
MTDDELPVAGDGAEDPGDAPDIHENGGDPLPEDPAEAPTQPPVLRTRAAVPPSPRGR